MAGSCVRGSDRSQGGHGFARADDPATTARFSRPPRGFTLIELTIALAVLSILVATALPAYQFSIVKANRAAAQAYVLDLANREEQYLLDARTYTTDRDTLLAIPGAVSPYYTVTITVPTGSTIANAYLITASPVATSMQKNDGNLTLTQDGTKGGKW
jgi:type IV pilus assembly protein PilE